MIDSIDENNNEFWVETICVDLRNEQTPLAKRMFTMAGAWCELARENRDEAVTAPTKILHPRSHPISRPAWRSRAAAEAQSASVPKASPIAITAAYRCSKGSRDVP